MASLKLFGRHMDKPVYLIKLTNGKMEAEFISFGATLRALRVLGKDGNMHDVCLGYDSVEEYAANDGYIGSTVGRNANRIGGSRFVLNGKEIILNSNEGENQLHGGKIGFSHRLWGFSCEENSVSFTISSPDGDEGYPAALRAEVKFSIEDTTLRIEYRASADSDTVVNMTNHAYFNLGGQESGNIYSHTLQLSAENYTVCGNGNIPTGEIASIINTPLDLRDETRLIEPISALENTATIGIDHNFVLVSSPAAILYCPETGIEMCCTTSLEGLQVYTSGFLTERKGKEGAMYGRHNGICLETQHFPDAVNHPHFPSSVLQRGEEYREWTKYSFKIR